MLDAMCVSLGERGFAEDEFVMLYDGVVFTDPWSILRESEKATHGLVMDIERDVQSRTGVSVRLRLTNITSTDNTTTIYIWV